MGSFPIRSRQNFSGKISLPNNGEEIMKGLTLQNTWQVINGNYGDERNYFK